MTTTSATPVTKVKALAEIERLGFDYEEVAQYDLEAVSKDRRVQVREVNHYAPKDSVERFAIQMNSTEFPPIVMTKDGWIVDGNTRVGAKLSRKEKFFPAYVLDVEWGTANDQRRDELHALAATLNAQNGVPLTGKETRDVVRRFVRLGWLNEQIGRAIGVKPATVTAVRKEIEAEAKLEKVGLAAEGKDAWQGAALRALGSKGVLALNDTPFMRLAELTRDADLRAKEIDEIAKAARESGSDAGAIQVVTDQRAEMKDRIAQKELTGSGKPPASASLRRFLGNVLKFEDREQELIETDPDQNGKHVDALARSVAVLTKVLEMQRGSLA